MRGMLNPVLIDGSGWNPTYVDPALPEIQKVGKGRSGFKIQTRWIAYTRKPESQKAKRTKLALWRKVYNGIVGNNPIKKRSGK